MDSTPTIDLTADDEELIMRGIHQLQKLGERGPWHVTFHPTSRPGWVQAEAFVSTVGDIYLHPQWGIAKDKLWIQSHLEYQMIPVGAGAN